MTTILDATLDLSGDPLWAAIRSEVDAAAHAEPALAGYLYSTVLAHTRLEDALSYLLAGKLEEATRTTEAGGRARKIVNVPPQVGKTRLVSRLFVAWFMGRNPYLNVILACHNSKLAASIGDDVLGYIKHPDYAKVFPRVSLSGSSKSKTEFKLFSDGELGGERS